MIRLTWIVFLHAGLLSAESILIEVLALQLGIPALVVAGNSIVIAGVVLVGISVFKQRRETVAVFAAWKYIVPASALLALGVFTWYDSVTRVGAAKEGLLAGPLEVIVIIILARLVLYEKLHRARMAGVVIALVGFFASVASSGTTGLALTTGDIEAILSALSFGAGIIFVTKLTKNHGALAVTGSLMFLCGSILAAFLWFSSPLMGPREWLAVLAFSLVPIGAAYTYVVGLARIGASLTSTIASFSIILTLIIQMVVALFGGQPLLPQNIALAIFGGSLGVFGIYIIHSKGD